MPLTAFPFSQETGELLPVYRDAYLRGDLSAEHTRMVDEYLRKNTAPGTETWQRFHEMAQTGEQVQAVGWMQRQIDLVQTSAGRTRRQAASLMAAAVLVGGAVFASTVTSDAPTKVAPIKALALLKALTTPVETPIESPAATEALAMTTISGKILDENGQPLIGATVFEKSTRRAVSTNAEGDYVLQVPAGRPTTLAYGYGGYTNEEVLLDGNAVENVTLVPAQGSKVKPARKVKRWLFFN